MYVECPVTRENDKTDDKRQEERREFLENSFSIITVILSKLLHSVHNFIHFYVKKKNKVNSGLEFTILILAGFQKHGF